MANVFLSANETFTAANNGLVIKGAAGGTEKLLIGTNVTGVTTDANIERIEVAGNLADYKLVIGSSGIQITNAAGTVIATIPSLNQATTLAFADGSASLVQTGATAATLGGTALSTTTAAAVTVTTPLNTTDKSTVTAGSTTGGTTSFVLTASNKVAALTSSNDTVDATTNVNTSSGATIIDSTLTDSDVINAKITANATPAAIQNVETINLDSAGFNLTTDVSNVQYGATGGTTINLKTTQLGNDAATLKGFSTKYVNVAPDTSIKTLTLQGSSGGATDATAVTLAGGSLALSQTSGTGVDALTLISKVSANTVTLTVGNSGTSGTGTTITAKGDQDLTLKMNGVTDSGAQNVGITKDASYTKTLTLDITASGNTGGVFSYAQVDKIILSGTQAGNTVTFRDNANVSLTAASGLSGSTVKVDLPGGTSSKTLNLSADIASAMLSGSTGTIGSGAANIDTLNLTSNVTAAVGSGSATGGAATLKMSSASGSGTQAVINLLGTADQNLLALGAGNSGATVINAAGMSGKLYLQTTAGGAAGTSQVVGSNQADTIYVDTSGISTIVGGSGDDTIFLNTNNAHKITGSAGADSFVIAGSGSGSSGTIKDFTLGTDIIVLTGTQTFIDASKAIVTSGVFNSGSGGAVTLENVTTSTGGDDWSASLQFGNSATVMTVAAGSGAIKAGNYADNISFSAATGRTVDGGSGNDKITLTAGASGATVTITGGAGDDTIDLLGTTGSGVGQVKFAATASANGSDSITGFDANTANHADTLNFTAFLTTATVWTGSGGNDTSGQSSSGTGVIDFATTGLSGSSSGNDVFVTYSIGKSSLTTADIALSGTGAGKIAVEDNSKAVVLLAVGAAAGTVANVYYVENGATSGLGDVTVSLVGTVSFTNSDTIDDLVAANFVVA